MLAQNTMASPPTRTINENSKNLFAQKLTLTEHRIPDIDTIFQIGADFIRLRNHGYTILINRIQALQNTPKSLDHPLWCAIELNKEADWLAGADFVKKHDSKTG